MGRPQPTWRVRLFLLFLSVVLALLVAELALRLLGVDGPSHDTGIVPHPLWHHWHQPGHAFEYRVPGEPHAIPTRYNEHGMRTGRAVEVAHGTDTRIAVLGDSFVEALQVSEEEGIARQLEGGLHAEILNFGCSGFSTTLELVLLREFVLKFQPDAVILCHHFSDVTEDWRFASSAEWDGNQLVAVRPTGSGRGRQVRAVLEFSQLYRAASGVADRRRHRAPPPAASLKESFDAIIHEPYTVDDEEAWDYSLAALKQIAELLKQNNIPLLVALIPLGPQVEPVDPAFAQQVGFRYLADGQKLRECGYQDHVKSFCRDARIRVLDLLPIFVRANPKGTPRLYLQRDQHWTAAGHELAAHTIADAFVANGWHADTTALAPSP